MHDDMQVIRLQQMTKCFEDGQIPCRMSLDLGGAYSQPHFNYYSAFPYYLGSIIHQIGFSYLDSIKILFFLSIFLSAFGLYHLSRHFFSNTASLASVILISLSTYRLVNIYVRGALAESFALALLPGVIALFLTLIKPTRLKIILSAIVFSFFLTSHPISIVINTPIFVLVGLYLLFKSRQGFIGLVLSVCLGLGLSAFFLLPAFIEQPLINTISLLNDYYQYALHYPTIKQLLLETNWGYGPSRPGPEDGFSYHIGYAHLLILAISSLLTLKKLKNFITLVVALSLGYLFLNHARSVGIWEVLPLVRFVQFPWRLLGPLSLLTSFLAAFVLSRLPQKFQKFALVVVFLIAFIPMSANLHFDKYYQDATDQQYLSGAGWDQQRKAASHDYLPAGIDDLPTDLAPDNPIALNNAKINLHYFDRKTNYFATEIDVYDESATIQFPVLKFPQWQVHLNKSTDNATLEEDSTGLISIKLPKGSHHIQAYFTDTPVRTLANIITFASYLLVVLLIL